MGKQAAPKVLAGAQGIGTAGMVFPDAPTLKSVTSAKRERILEGMLDAVGSSGYDGTSVRTVLTRTGLYRQAFYDNFPDKDACYLEAFDLGVARLEALTIAAAGTEETWQGKLRAGLGAFLDALDREPNVGRALIVEVHAAGPEALERRAEMMKRIGDFIDSARDVSEDGESPPPIAPEGIVAGIHAIVHARLAAGATEGFRELLPEFMYFAVLPYFGSDMAEAEMQAARI
ncbi:MAG: TetR/AcrR family transcriptional regulator [Solirubrobacterales bacterium]